MGEYLYGEVSKVIEEKENCGKVVIGFVIDNASSMKRGACCKKNIQRLLVMVVVHIA